MIPGAKNKSLIPLITAAIFAGALIWWLSGYNNQDDIAVRVPGMDNRPKVEPRSDSVIIGEFFDTLGTFDEFVAGSWPRFRGSDFDNISRDSFSLFETWDTTGPEKVWQVTLGEGYAGAAVSNGRVYLLDYNERRKADMLRCFSLKSGVELWRRWYYVDIKRNHGYSRTIPAVNDKYLVTLGPRSHVMCLDPLTGNMYWSLDLEKEYFFEGEDKSDLTPDFYSGQCPVIDNDVAILAPGGRALMIGVDCATGNILWETPNPDKLRMSHCSIMPMTIHGKKMYVYHGVGGVCGVSAEGDDIGKIMWSTTEWGPAIVAASPLYLGNNEMVAFGAYGTGAARIKIDYFGGSEYKVTVSEKHKSTAGISTDQQTPIFIGEHIWCLMPENAGILKRQLACYHRSDIITPVWTSGKDSRFGRGLGPYVVRGDKMFLLDDDGNLFLFKLDASSASLITSHKILDGFEAWGPMALAGNYLIMRDARNLVCLKVGNS